MHNSRQGVISIRERFWQAVIFQTKVEAEARKQILMISYLLVKDERIKIETVSN